MVMSGLGTGRVAGTVMLFVLLSGPRHVSSQLSSSDLFASRLLALLLQDCRCVISDQLNSVAIGGDAIDLCGVSCLRSQRSRTYVRIAFGEKSLKRINHKAVALTARRCLVELERELFRHSCIQLHAGLFTTVFSGPCRTATIARKNAQ